MSEHPLRSYARRQSVSLADIAVAAGTSRMSINRIIRGENTTIALLRRVSAATGGEVTVEQLVANAHAGKDTAAPIFCPVPITETAAPGGAR